jgi:hypothetical protein
MQNRTINALLIATLAAGFASAAQAVGAPTDTPKFTSIKLLGGDVVVEWTGGGTIEAADDITGPWAAVAGATNAFKIPASSVRKFTRIKQSFAAELIGKGVPVEVAHFFAAAKLESSSPNANTYVYRQTFPNGATREMTMTITPQQYTPTPNELAKFPPGTSPIYSFTYGSGVQPDGTMRIDLHYFVPNDGLPAELRTRLQSSALTANGIRTVAHALDGPVAGAGIAWQETGKEAFDWTIGTALELYNKHPNIKATGSIYALASALSDFSDSVELSKEINKWLAELDALEKCAAHPTNPLAKKDPNYSRDTVEKIQQVRGELKEVSAVRYLIIMTDTGSGFTPATAALMIALKSGFQWSDQTLKNYSEEIMREARAAVVACSAFKVDGIYWGYHLTGVICNLENTFALQAQSSWAASGVFTFTPAGTNGGTWIFSGAMSGFPVTANGTYQIAGVESGTPQILMDPGNGTWTVYTPAGNFPMGPGGNHLGVPETITMTQTTESCPDL